MDNMLYIIAGLVLIVLVAGLVLRKKKAQEPSVQPAIKTEKKAAVVTPAVKTNSDTATHSREDIDKKFDHITIAQRFIDQQRYDKAIETLDRGLTEKPNDSQLLLKLLGIYATIDQPENFNQVYDAIKAHNDAKSIAQANQLKGLFFEEQSPIAAQELPVENDANFESIDFDLPTGQFVDNQANNQKPSSDQSMAQDDSPTLSDDSSHDEIALSEFDQANSSTDAVEDSFDLTLSDFEDDFDQPAATGTTPVTSLDTENSESLNNPTTNETNSDETDSDISDFDFNFDVSEDSSAPAEIPVATSGSDDTRDEIALESDEFILDFDDLVTDTETNTNETLPEALTVDSIEDNEDDFVLSLDDFDASDSTETPLEDETPRTEELRLEEPSVQKTSSEEASLEDNSDFDNFVLEDHDFENTGTQDNNLEDSPVESRDLETENLTSNSFEDINLEEVRFDDNDLENDLTETTNVTPTAPTDTLVLDDNTLIADDTLFSDDFGLEDSTVPTSVAPVTDNTVVTTDGDAESAEDFSSRFSADFDFVKSLDSNQVTLDLANQYIQLGEYDSAKRLLNEVVARGNDEQQNQAKILLQRTA
ncbi:FimV/HubP family polar landmark protein [Psychrobacter sp. B38]|uniref:FimV/HubP family polar landmark protein n=1 Tax=Psychrobacter sp. B38 TaxID=3143538 RepID=UPI00320E0D05